LSWVSLAAIQNLPPNLRLQILSLGASRLTDGVGIDQRSAITSAGGDYGWFLEGSFPKWALPMMVGGNIKGYSRVLTTATVMETGKGILTLPSRLSISFYCLLSWLIFCSHRYSKGSVRDEF